MSENEKEEYRELRTLVENLTIPISSQIAVHHHMILYQIPIKHMLFLCGKLEFIYRCSKNIFCPVPAQRQFYYKNEWTVFLIQKHIFQMHPCLCSK